MWKWLSNDYTRKAETKDLVIYFVIYPIYCLKIALVNVTD